MTAGSNEHSRISHANLPNQSTNIDKQIEPVVDSGNGSGMVDNHALARLGGDDFQLVERHLFRNQGRDVGLETSRSDTHDDNSYSKSADGRIGVVEHRRDRGNDKYNVSDDGDYNSNPDSAEASEVSVGNPCAK